MSQLLRVGYPDAWYHVMNGGGRAEDVFLGDEATGHSLLVFAIQSTGSLLRF